MTPKEYKEKVASELAEKMFVQISNHNDSFTAESETNEFWLIDVKNSLIPGRLKRMSYSVEVSGYYVVLKSVSELPVSIRYGTNRFYVGNRFFWVFSFERAVENMSYSIQMLELYSREYDERMSSAEIELQKAAMIRDINAVTAESFLTKSLDELGVRFQKRNTEKQMKITAELPQGRHEYRINLESNVERGVNIVVGKIRKSVSVWSSGENR